MFIDSCDGSIDSRREVSLVHRAPLADGIGDDGTRSRQLTDSCFHVDMRHGIERPTSSVQKLGNGREARLDTRETFWPRRKITREQQVQRRPRVPLHRVPLHTCELINLESLALESRPQDLEIDQVNDIEFDIVDRIDSGQLIVDLSRP